MKDSRLIIEGGRRLSGELKVTGAKNASLPILAGALLTQGESVLHNCPALSDVFTACRILTHLGCRCRRENSELMIDSQDVCNYEISDELMRKMRSSIVFLGAVLSRAGRCRLSFPGGCELGARPIDIHLAAMRKMGVKIKESYGVLDCTLDSGLDSCDIVLPFPSVGATENIMLLAARSNATVTIINAAREPEISDLEAFLNACGANIHGAGSSTVTVRGVQTLHPCEYSVMPDRIVASTYMSAAAITSGELMLTGVKPAHMHSVFSLFEQMGCSVYSYDDKIYINAKNPLKAVKTIKTAPYPGFPTDCQPIVMAALCRARGTSIIYENIFENRYRAVPELIRMGADIKVEGKVAVVEGVNSLWGTSVKAPDLRAGAALVLAGLAGEGTTTVSDIHYIDRGYESIENELCSVGAKIIRR